MSRALVPSNRKEVAVISGDPKAENFKRLAEQRTSKVLDELRKLGNLSNKNNYAFTDEQVDRIYKTIARELVMSRRKFSPGFKTFTFDNT